MVKTKTLIISLSITLVLALIIGGITGAMLFRGDDRDSREIGLRDVEVDEFKVNNVNALGFIDEGECIRQGRERGFESSEWRCLPKSVDPIEPCSTLNGCTSFNIECICFKE